jgi:hypothetical protein
MHKCADRGVEAYRRAFRDPSGKPCENRQSREQAGGGGALGVHPLNCSHLARFFFV